MAIEWTGLFANTGYSSANNKAQDDAVVGMQDTLYVTGPGYGAYEAIVRLHSSTGAVVASVGISGGGGAVSAPPPVRFVDNGAVYSYSLEVLRGYIPTEDASGIVIRLVGGASKRHPSPMSVTPSGDVQIGGAVLCDEVGAIADCPQRFHGANIATPEFLAKSWFNSYDNNGVISPLTNFAATWWIPVSPGDVLYGNHSAATAPAVNGWFYDANYARIATAVNIKGIAIAPANAAWARMNYSMLAPIPLGIFVFTPSRTASKKDQFTLVSAGDSITKGYGLPGGEAQAYPAIVGRLIGAKSVVNLGASGSTLTNWAGGTNPFSTRIATDIIPSDAGIFTMKYGVNDYRMGAPLGTISDTTNATFYGALDVVAVYLRANRLQARSIFIIPLYTDPANAVSAVATQAQYAQAIRDVGAKYQLQVIDMNECGVPTILPMAHPYRQELEQPLLHPNAAAQLMMGRFVARKILAP